MCHKTITLLIALFCATNIYAIDIKDQGEYLLLSPKDKSMSMQMRYTHTEQGWIMDGKKGDDDWYPVCRQSPECKLMPSSPEQVKQLQAKLPSQWHSYPMSCIENQAFAFCRLSDKDNTNRRLYWWFPLTSSSITVLPVNRVR